MKPEDIVEKYARENADVSAETRMQYKAIKLPFLERLSDDKIKALAANDITPKYFEEIAEEVYCSIRDAFELIEQGKLNGKVYKEWRSKAISVGNTLFGIDRGYTLQEAIRVRTSFGRSLREFDEFRQNYLFLWKFLSDRNQIPKKVE